MSTLEVEQFPSRTSNYFFLKGIFLSSMSASIFFLICQNRTKLHATNRTNDHLFLSKMNKVFLSPISNKNMRQFGVAGCAWNLKPFSWAIVICSSFLICPTNSWPQGVWMLSVFKLVSCKPGTSRELDLRPPREAWEAPNVLY